MQPSTNVGGVTATQDTILGAGATNNSGFIRNINNINNNNAGIVGDEDESGMFCGPTNARNLFWNITRVGESNVQPCPGM